MEQQIRDRYSDAVLREAMRRYEIEPGQIQPIDSFESFIYEFERAGQGAILRIGHSLRRSEALILGEIDWINYLAAGGASVASALPSRAGKLVEAIDDAVGGQFLASAFVKAQGRPPRQAGWTPALYQTYGQLLGTMHTLTQRYEPGDPAWRRPEWDDPSVEMVERFLPASEALAKQKYRALCDELRRLPQDRASYGLIHQDAHGENFLVDADGTITLFDFDDCMYSWFINDIAIVLFYIVMNAEDAPAFTREFMTHFLRGYRRAADLDPRWLREIGAFLKLREIEMYAVIHRDFDVTAIDNGWCARFMQGRKQKIEQDVPFIDFDFESL